MLKGEPALSLDEKARLSQGSVSSLSGRRLKVSIVCLENRELAESASKRFQITPSLSARASVCPHTSVYSYLSLLSPFPRHCPALPIVLFTSRGSASCSLSRCLPGSSAAFLPSSLHLSHIQTCQSSSISVQRSPVSSHSHSVSSRSDHSDGPGKVLQNKSGYKSTDCGAINRFSNGARTSKAAREFILVMRWRDALRISQLGL